MFFWNLLGCFFHCLWNLPNTTTKNHLCFHICWQTFFGPQEPQPSTNISSFFPPQASQAILTVPQNRLAPSNGQFSVVEFLVEQKCDPQAVCWSREMLVNVFPIPTVADLDKSCAMCGDMVYLSIDGRG